MIDSIWDLDRSTDLSQHYRDILYDRRRSIKLEGKQEVTNNALTPYFARRAVAPGPNTPGSLARMEYEGYNLFALDTSLRPGIRDNFNGLFHKLVYLNVGDKLVMEVQLTDGALNLPLSVQDRDKIENLISSFINWNPNACWMLDDAKDLFHRQVRMDKAWLSSVLPRFNLPSTVSYNNPDSIFYSQPSEYEAIRTSNSIFAVLDPQRDYRYGYLDLQTKILDKLAKLRRKGCLLLDPERDKNFIENWELVPLRKQENIDNRRLYKPSSTLRWIGTDSTSLLLECYRSSSIDTKLKIPIPYSRSYSLRDAIVRKLNSESQDMQRHFFFQDRMVQEIEDLKSLKSGIVLINSIFSVPQSPVVILESQFELMLVKDTVRYNVVTEGEVASSRQQ